MRKYQTFLVRVWEVDEGAELSPMTRRFVLETVSDAPQRWKFDSFQQLVAFLGAEFGEPTPLRPPTRRKSKSKKENPDAKHG
jgi:hypothetical protein